MAAAFSVRRPNPRLAGASLGSSLPTFRLEAYGAANDSVVAYVRPVQDPAKLYLSTQVEDVRGKHRTVAFPLRVASPF